jgi:hypothetical protein
MADRHTILFVLEVLHRGMIQHSQYFIALSFIVSRDTERRNTLHFGVQDLASAADFKLTEKLLAFMDLETT